MGFSRRTFLGVATCVVARMLVPKITTRPLAKVPACGSEPIDCLLLDAQQRCALPESLSGYESALRAIGVRFVKTCGDSLPPASTIIVPACLALRSEVTQEIAAALRGGSCVVLESGAGFATQPEFAAHQEWLRNYWSVRVEAPVDLWNDNLRDPRCQTLAGQGPSPLAARVPYVDFRWPFRTKIRDFSRVVPVSAQPEQVVASCGDWRVASMHAKGKGTLVFLGSPLGPALLAGDAEAHRWLWAIIEKQS
jgi:hypothetical protein